MPLFARAEDLEAGRADAPGGGHLITKMVYGRESSLMYAVRPGGYHSKPHIHNSEQLNYVLDGEIWVFVDDKAFLVKAGDFYRIPAMAVHWGWIRSEKPCTILEVHTPPLEHGYPHVVALTDEHETLDTKTHARNYLVSDEYLKIEKQVVDQDR